MKITLKHLRDIVDGLEIAHLYNKEDENINFVMKNDNGDSIRFTFFVEEDRSMIHGMAILCEKDASEEAIAFCNSWNKERSMPKAFWVEEVEAIVCRWTWDTEPEWTDELLEGLVIAGFVQASKICFDEALEAGLYQ